MNTSAAARLSSKAEGSRIAGEVERAEPQPAQGGQKPAHVVARVGSYVVEVLPFLVLLRCTYLPAPWLPFAILFFLTAMSLILWRRTPGQRLFGLELCMRSGADASTELGLLRFMLQHGWLLFVSLFVEAAYRSSPYVAAWGWTALVWAVVSLTGALGALLGRRQTLYDWLTATRVMTSQK